MDTTSEAQEQHPGTASSSSTLLSSTRQSRAHAGLNSHLAVPLAEPHPQLQPGAAQYEQHGDQDPGQNALHQSRRESWLHNYTFHKNGHSEGFIWDSLDNNMEEVQEARRARKNGPIRLLTNRKETSYNTLRATFRLQYAEKRRSDIHNFVSSIRLGLDYDDYKAKIMALLNSKPRIVFFIIVDLIVDTLFCILYVVEAEWLAARLDDPREYPHPAWLFVWRPHPIWVVAVTMSSWNLMSAFVRFLFADSKLHQPFDPVKARLIALIAYFITILFNGMAAFLYCETMFATNERPHTVGDAFYFILITASTVGYGDITPKSTPAKVVVMLFIIVTLSIVPGLIAATIETVMSSRSGGGSYTQGRSASGVLKQYLVMIGDFQSPKRVGDMLSRFFNKEFSYEDLRVVFLSRNKPSSDVKNLLDMPKYKSRTTMLVGNGLDESDLERCQVRGAGAVFVIPDRATTDLESQDTMTTLLAWSIHIHAPNTRIYTYNLLPETESFQWGIVEKSMCISDVKQLLLAYNCRHRGTATLIFNLLHPSEPANSYEDGWRAQYGDGTGNELYVGPVPSVFVGWTFAQASWFIFQEFQSIVVGVDIFLKAENAFTAGERRSGLHSHAWNDRDARGRPRSWRQSRSVTAQNLRETRAEARAAAKARWERRDKNRKARQRGESPEEIAVAAAATAAETPEEMVECEVLSSPHDPWTTMGYVLPNQGASMSPLNKGLVRRIGPKQASLRSRVSGSRRKSRPAWNVALYDDDDDDYEYFYDDDGDGDEDSNNRGDDEPLSDSISLHRVKSGQSRHSRHSRYSNKSRQNEEQALGALEREMRGDTPTSPTNTHLLGASSSMSGSSSGPGSGLGNDSCNTGATSSIAACIGSPMINDTGLASSNFDLNAAAAAAREGRRPPLGESEAKTQMAAILSGLSTSPQGMDDGALNEKGTVVDVEGTPAKHKQQQQQVPLVTIQPPPPGCTTAMSSPSMSFSLSSKAESGQSRPNPKRRNSTRTSVNGSFQTLDESTYVGQTSVTRSETKDLPLCHLLIHPPETIKPLVRDDLSNLKNHIVVCADMSENLYRFLATLRLAQISREDLKTIVVLTKNPIDKFTSENNVILDQNDEVDANVAHQGISVENMSDGRRNSGNWDAILSFPRVFWVSGNCRHQRDLVRAGILSASSIVVMSHSTEGRDRDELADSTAIMSHHMIYQTLKQRRLLGQQHIIVEIAEKSNIRFLNMHDVNRGNNDGDDNGLRSKVTRSRSGGGFAMTPLFASGQVLVSTLLDNVLFQAYSKTHILDLIKLCCGVRFKQEIELDQMLGIDSSNICLIPTPPEFVGQSFLKMFQVLALLYGIVPLGLYRAPDRELNNQLPFVFTNPLPGILLKATDMIYVLKS
ncbi:hypothetical protein BGZ94_000181 [Podila epigama]|nr:hypothetical protein BGZ94_000181 [Podila epigama]